jgi:hypothetical protein
MEVFFNELSVKTAATDEEANEWLENLAHVGKLLKQVIESLGESSFRFRSREDFFLQRITNDQTFFEFLQSRSSCGDPIYIFLLGIFDSPYIADDDPQKMEYELLNISINGKDHDSTGIAAAYLKSSLVISLNCDDQWDTCQLNVSVNRLNESAEIITEEKQIKHASKKQHVINCHLPFLAKLYDWSSYKPCFIPSNNTQTILPLIEIYSFYIGENISDWKKFYCDISKLNSDQRVSKIKEIAEKISIIHCWDKATGSLERNNRDRLIYIIPSSDFIVSVDTQHGEFEIHINHQGNNHLGAISFDGEIKGSVAGRCLSL